MTLIRLYILFSAIFVIVGFSGCAKYKVRPLDPLIPMPLEDSKDKSVSFDYRVFSKDVCYNYLDRDVISKGYQPIQISIANNTNRYLGFSLMNFSFPCVAAELVAPLVHTSTVGRSVGYGVAGLILWPFLIPAVVDGIGSAEANTQLDLDFSRKALRDQIVGPYMCINGLVFAPCGSFQPRFSFVLIDQESHQKIVLDTVKKNLCLR